MATRKFSTTKDILKFEGQDVTAYWKRYSMLLTLSVVIATMGLLRDSATVVIAAMLVAPLMAPILGLAAAMVVGRTKRVVHLLLVVSISAVLSVAVAWLLVYVSDVPRGILIPDQVLARTNPGTEDLVIALAAGVAGAYVQIQKSEISLLPGAAIGVSLVPPLTAAGILIYFGEWNRAYEASLLFVTNLGAIILSACAVYLFSGALKAVFIKSKRRTRFSISLVITTAVLSLVAFQLLQSTYYRYLETQTEAELAARIEEWADPTPVEIVRVNVNSKLKTVDIWAIVDLPLEAQYQVSSVRELMPEHMTEAATREMLRSALGEDYYVALRYQTRIAVSGNLRDGIPRKAPKVKGITHD